jgi:hypothetical protein
MKGIPIAHPINFFASNTRLPLISPRPLLKAFMSPLFLRFSVRVCHRPRIFIFTTSSCMKIRSLIVIKACASGRGECTLFFGSVRYHRASSTYESAKRAGQSGYQFLVFALLIIGDPMSSLVQVGDVRSDQNASKRSDHWPDIFHKVPQRNVEINEELTHSARIVRQRFENGD